MKKIEIFLVIVLVIGVFFLISPSSAEKDDEELKLDNFAQCLTNANLTMYGTEWCSHCQNQKKLFGKSFKYINYIDCDRKSEICSQKSHEFRLN